MTLSPLGEWTGWYQSEEIKNAEKYGYKYTILEGYIFKSQNMFSGFVIAFFFLFKLVTDGYLHTISIYIKYIRCRYD